MNSNKFAAALLKGSRGEVAMSSRRRTAIIVATLVLCLGSGVARAEKGPHSRVTASPADRGIVASFDGGASMPVAAGSSMDMGYHFGGTLGFELRAGGPGSRLSLTPELVATYARWSLAGPMSLKASQTMWTIQAGGKITYYLGPVGLWAGLHAGYGEVALDVMGIDISSGGVALKGSAGATVMIGRYVGVGPYAEYNKTIVDMAGPFQVGAAELDFGLRLTAKLPL